MPLGFSSNPLGEGHFPHRFPHIKGWALQYRLIVLGSSQPMYVSQPLEWGNLDSIMEALMKPGV